MRIEWKAVRTARWVLSLPACVGYSSSAQVANPLTLQNVPYDPARELYQEDSGALVRHRKELGWGEATVDTVEMSHGGSSKQAPSVIDGPEADLANLRLAHDIDAISQKAQQLPTTWRGRLSHNSCRYTSTVIGLIRKGNPNGIHDWPDLIKLRIAVIAGNPKTSGHSRWNYLAPWGAVLKCQK